MEIRTAKTAGFCFGVKRAVDAVYKALEEGRRIATLGDIIHNRQVIEDLESRGVRSYERVSDIPAECCIVIRAHGVGKDVYDEIGGREYIDLTCPFVAKIHKIVEKHYAEGYKIVIVGDASHPEVIGINGWCGYEAEIIDSETGKINSDLSEKPLCIVAQTTINKKNFVQIVQNIKNTCKSTLEFDTICSATKDRQEEAAELAASSDCMIVIGGRKSSNTRKLYEISKKLCPNTYHVETAGELPHERYNKIGITAGASTPAHIIKEVLKTMSEILRNEENEDFATLLEQSLESEKIYNGKRVTGVVTSVAPNEVHVDIGAKQAGIVPVEELTDDPNAKVEDLVKKGDEIELCVVKVNDQEGIVTLSKKRCDAQKGFEKIKEAYENGTVLDAVITDVVRGGVLAYTCNTKIFIPAPHCSNTRVEDLSTLLKKPVRIMIIEVNENRNRAKGSVRAVLNAERKAKQEKFWEEVEIGKVYTGEVKSLTSYGAFVDLGGIDGMIHVTELAWTKVKHPSEIVNVGDMVEVYIKDFDREKKRISLGYKKECDNPWTIFTTKYSVGDVVKVKIVSFATYGAFAEILPGVDGLIHISQIANQHVEKIADVLKLGEEVDAKIIAIDTEKKRVSLSMRALLSEEEQKREHVAETAEEDDSVTE